MHIVGLVEHPDHVCARYRLAAFQPHLESAGHQLELRAVPRGFWSRLRLWWSLRKADVVVVQRRLLAGLHRTLLRRNARRLIFDFDDAIYRRDSYSAKHNESSIRLRRFIAMLHAADRVVAGNDHLGTEAGRFVSAERIRVVPTCVDPASYPLAEHQRCGEGVRLVWIGSSSTLRGLERKQPLIDVIAREVPGVQLQVICDRFPRFKTMPVIATPWSQLNETQHLAEADIGISWMPADRWSEGKCGLKVLQYMAAGLPVVANAVGVQARMIRHGETGFLVETPDQWVAAIRRLAGDPGLRRRMGRAGRRVVEREYSVTRGAQLWLEVLGTLEAARRRLAA